MLSFKNINAFNISLAIIVLFVLVLPDDVFKWKDIYEMNTPVTIDYNWLDYRFGAIQLIICLLGFVCAIKLKKVKYVIAIATIMLLREFIFIIMGKGYVFSFSSYEMYLSLTTGCLLYMLTEGVVRSKNNMDLFFKFFLIANILTIYIDVFRHEGIGLTRGRFHASNLDVGGTAFLCVIAILYFFFSDSKKWYEIILTIVSAAGLVLTGSRIYLIVMPCIVLWGLLSKKIMRKSERIASSIVLMMLIAFFVLLFIFFSSKTFMNPLQKEKFDALMNIDSIEDDSSFLGRTDSINIGLDILKENPFGLSCSFLNLQGNMIERSYPTFPHSMLIILLLLWGPIVIFLYVFWIKLAKSLYGLDKRYYLILTFLIISSLLDGAPPVNFKIVYIYFIITGIAKKIVQESNNVQNDEIKNATPNEMLIQSINCQPN